MNSTMAVASRVETSLSAMNGASFFWPTKRSLRCGVRRRPDAEVGGAVVVPVLRRIAALAVGAVGQDHVLVGDAVLDRRPVGVGGAPAGAVHASRMQS